MGDDRIKDHPSAIMRREIDLLKLRLEVIEQEYHHTAKALIAVNINQRELQDLLLKTNRIVSAASSQFSEILELKRLLQGPRGSSD
jgi:hypothetical protein